MLTNLAICINQHVSKFSLHFPTVFAAYPLEIQDSYGKSQFSMGKSLYKWTIFYSYVQFPEGLTTTLTTTNVIVRQS